MFWLKTSDNAIYKGLIVLPARGSFYKAYRCSCLGVIDLSEKPIEIKENPIEIRENPIEIKERINFFSYEMREKNGYHDSWDFFPSLPWLPCDKC